MIRIEGEVLEATAGKRLRQRLRVDMRAEMRRPLCKGVPVCVTDLSANGCRFESREQLSAERFVWLKLPGLEALYSRIAWARDCEAGCEFDRPLHPAVVERLIRSARAGGS